MRHGLGVRAFFCELRGTTQRTKGPHRNHGSHMRILKKLCAILWFSLLCLQAIPVDATERVHLEEWYQKKWCNKQGNQLELVLPDRTRCDCLTRTHAIEFDFANKWYEAIGQSLHYSRLTGKRPGIVLILESPTDKKYWHKLNKTIEHFKLHIDTWSIGEGAY